MTLPGDFQDYYDTLTLGEALVQRIAHLETQILTLTPEPLQDAFVSNWQSAGEVPNYLSLFFFTENLLYEVKTFATSAMIECDVLRYRIRNLAFQIDDFDFQSPTSLSRFYVRYVTVNDLMAEFRATDNNCTQLWGLTQKYLLTNLETNFTETA